MTDLTSRERTAQIVPTFQTARHKTRPINRVWRAILTILNWSNGRPSVPTPEAETLESVAETPLPAPARVTPSILKPTGAANKGSAPSPTGRPSRPCVAIVIGHNEVAQGAYSKTLDVTEWAFNQTVFDAMKAREETAGLTLRAFHRKRSASGYSAEIRTVYAAVNAWNPVAVLELHFNAAASRASGTEMLHLAGSSKGEVLAHALQQACVTALDLPDRGLLARTSRARGGLSLVSAKAPTVLAEPFFGSSPDDCARLLEIGVEGLAEAYLDGLQVAVSRLGEAAAA